MTDTQLVRRLVKPVLWLLGLSPLAWLLVAGFQGNLTADPVKYITHYTGRVTLILLMVTLSVTTVRRLTGWQPVIRVRRLVGLFAFFYATVHLLIYLVFDRGFVFTELGEDIAKRPYITIGFTAWTILLALAATSPKAMVRRLGGRRWQRLHRLVYVVPVLGLLHFTWAQKRDLSPVLPYLAALALVFAVRLGVRRWRGGSAHGASRAPASASD